MQRRVGLQQLASHRGAPYAAQNDLPDTGPGR